MSRSSSALCLCAALLVAGAGEAMATRCCRTTRTVGLKERISRNVGRVVIGAAFVIPLGLPILGGWLDTKVRADVKQRTGVEVTLGNDWKYRVGHVADASSPLRIGDVVLKVNGTNLSPWRGSAFGADSTATLTVQRGQDHLTVPVSVAPSDR